MNLSQFCLMLRLGFGRSVQEAVQPPVRTLDGGVDRVISRDTLGLDGIYPKANRQSGKASLMIAR